MQRQSLADNDYNVVAVVAAAVGLLVDGFAVEYESKSVEFVDTAVAVADAAKIWSNVLRLRACWQLH